MKKEEILDFLDSMLGYFGKLSVVGANIIKIKETISNLGWHDAQGDYLPDYDREVMHLNIAIGFISFIIGVVLTHLAHKDTIKKLENENNHLRTTTFKKLTDAYDRIEQLEKDAKVLLKQINVLRNVSKN